jgi:hypothetical protein
VAALFAEAAVESTELGAGVGVPAGGEESTQGQVFAELLGG